MAISPKIDSTKNNLGRAKVALKKGVTVNAADAAKYQTLDTLNTALKTAGYTDNQLNVMSKNDKVYALRKVTGHA